MKPRFYGWTLVGIGMLLYGLGMAPGYYSWGFFAPEIIAELGLTRQQIGEVFGAFTLVFALTSTLSAVAIQRYGLRLTVSLGALVGAVGWLMVGRAQSLVDLYLSYSLLGGIGIGLATLLPAQTLPVYWFRKYRARATSIILLGAAIFGAAVTPVDAFILERFDWRTAWVFISGTAVAVAVIAAVFLRNKPEDIGQRRDGLAPGEVDPADDEDPDDGARSGIASLRQFTLRQAIATPQFFIATFADIAVALPWRTLTAHGRLHLENLGFAPTLAAAVLGVRVGMSGFGRLSGSLGDFVRPTRVLALALVLNGLGIGALRFAETPALAYASVTLMGIGYGAGFSTVPVVFGSFFGRQAFASTAGLRLAVTGIVGFIGPSWVGAAADRTGSYNGSLVVLALICMAGAVLIFGCRSPKQGRAATWR